MEIKITELESCKLLVHYEANAMEILDKRAEVQNAFKKAPVKGFREGKATMDAIKMHYRQQIEDSLKRALAEDAFHNTVFNEKLKAHGAPRFNSIFLDNGKFVCEFEIHTKPDFELSQYKDLEIPKPHQNVDSNILAEQMMQELRVNLGEASPYSDDDFVQEGDKVIIDYEGFIDNEKVQNLSVEGEMLTIGKGALTGFDINLLGMKLGETREFDFTVPEGGLPSLSGKTVHFKVTVNAGSKTTLAALDDTLAQKIGKNTFTELQEQVSQAAFMKAANSEKLARHDAISKRLMSDTQCQVPNWMSVSEAKYLAHNSQLNWDTMLDMDKEKFIQVAEQNVKLALILDKIRENEPEAQLTDQEVFEMIKQNLANTKTNQNLDDIIQQMNKSGYLQILFSRIRDEYTMDYIVKSIKFIE